MGDTDIDFVADVIAQVEESDRPFSRDLLRDCYLKDLQQRGVAEQPEVSEKWIDYYWKRLSKVPFNSLRNASSSPSKLAKLLVELLGK